MVSATAPLPCRPRTGLVLGAGGVLSAAWMAGALAALQRRLPYPVGTLDLIVGTSAGSVMAAALRCGVTVDDIVEHQRGTALALLPALSEIDRDAGGPLPPLPRMRVGSPRLLLGTALAPHRVHPWVPVLRGDRLPRAGPRCRPAHGLPGGGAAGADRQPREGGDTGSQAPCAQVDEMSFAYRSARHSLELVFE